MTPVLLYSHEAEPVTRSLLTSTLDKDFNLVKLSLSSLLNDISIFDEIHDDQVKIEWTLPSGDKIRNTDNYYLINRILSIPEPLFDEFDTVDRAYSIAEFTAYLAFSIESFPKCSAKPSAFGLSGNHFSLPRQWDIVIRERENLKIVVPQYYLGNLSSIPQKTNLVFSTPHNYYFWKPNLNENNSSSFAFERPIGTPTICCVIGEEVEVYQYQCDDQINLSDSQLIKEIAFRLAHLFKSPISEILLFYDASKISFGMISSIPYASKNKPWFNAHLQSFLKKAC